MDLPVLKLNICILYSALTLIPGPFLLTVSLSASS